MESINQSTMLQPQGMDLGCRSSNQFPDLATYHTELVAYKMVEVLNDFTWAVHAINYATYLIFTRRLPYKKIINQLDKQHAKDVLLRLFKNSSDFATLIPRAIGLDAVAELSADKIQRSLNVKHVRVKENKFDGDSSVDLSSSQFNEDFTDPCFIDPIRPEIKPTILYNHPTTVWIRFHTTVPSPTIPYISIIQLKRSMNVYEVYIRKNKNVSVTIRRMFHILEHEFNATIIFCSELAYFMYNPVLFMSNYIKFTWCNMNQQLIFDPITAEDMKTLNIYIYYGLLHAKTTNLTNMPKETHGGLIAHTAERPKNALNKFQDNEICNVEGSRALQTTNSGSDFGTQSNYIEVLAEVVMTDNALDNDYYDNHKRKDTIT